MSESVEKATMQFMLDVVYADEVEPQLRLLGIKTDKSVEGPRIKTDKGD